MAATPTVSVASLEDVSVEDITRLHAHCSLHAPAASEKGETAGEEGAVARRVKKAQDAATTRMLANVSFSNVLHAARTARVQWDQTRKESLTLAASAEEGDGWYATVAPVVVVQTAADRSRSGNATGTVSVDEATLLATPSAWQAMAQQLLHNSAIVHFRGTSEPLPTMKTLLAWAAEEHLSLQHLGFALATFMTGQMESIRIFCAPASNEEQMPMQALVNFTVRQLVRSLRATFTTVLNKHAEVTHTHVAMGRRVPRDERYPLLPRAGDGATTAAGAPGRHNIRAEVTARVMAQIEQTSYLFPTDTDRRKACAAFVAAALATHEEKKGRSASFASDGTGAGAGAGAGASTRRASTRASSSQARSLELLRANVVIPPPVRTATNPTPSADDGEAFLVADEKLVAKVVGEWRTLDKKNMHRPRSAEGQKILREFWDNFRPVRECTRHSDSNDGASSLDEEKDAAASPSMTTPKKRKKQEHNFHKWEMLQHPRLCEKCDRPIVLHGAGHFVAVDDDSDAEESCLTEANASRPPIELWMQTPLVALFVWWLGARQNHDVSSPHLLPRFFHHAASLKSIFSISQATGLSRSRRFVCIPATHAAATRALEQGHAMPPPRLQSRIWCHHVHIMSAGMRAKALELSKYHMQSLVKATAQAAAAAFPVMTVMQDGGDEWGATSTPLARTPVLAKRGPSRKPKKKRAPRKRSAPIASAST